MAAAAAAAAARDRRHSLQGVILLALLLLPLLGGRSRWPSGPAASSKEARLSAGQAQRPDAEAIPVRVDREYRT